MQDSSFGAVAENAGTPAPLQKSEPLPGQEAYLYTYVLFREKREDGMLGLIKVCSAWGSPQEAVDDYKRVHATNEQCQMKWGYMGKWEPLRYPETDTEGTVDIVKLPGEKLTDEDEYCGETVAKRPPPPPVSKDILKPDLKKTVKMDAAVRNYRDDKKVAKMEEKKKQLRKQLIEETQKEMNDPQSLASYAQLQHIRLAQKSALIEYEAKVLEAQAAFRKTLAELAKRRQAYPHYEDQWQNEIRRLTKIFDARHAENNVVDKPVADIGYDQDENLANKKQDVIEDQFDTKVGIDAKAKQLADDLKSRQAGNNKSNENGKSDKGKEELDGSTQNSVPPMPPTGKINKAAEEIAKSFIPESNGKSAKKNGDGGGNNNNKKNGDGGNKKKKNKKDKKKK